ncbi:UbiH/UbiF/VisC/COQ6 family ubiquinone biosynthesis hydroxylase [Asticcacaulis sp. YBE204]|uniref:UbiH/UbiF/VisC/COQ6 family ubiquinone biosynthesis hydroxylase n=1 Tax=Asticcacaulis sp. YBE204 TaxID=1282363 RepID=UPI0003C3BCE1|nr:UbiH/UbiF/VisC/COQ6 family ubiquinone biosynthesis hydroxylase [Asticcacaulis sp. YBE204]ESQ80977.1 2-octaprenyl-6-methoxyphenyl hydroxylase [Asticcacaulis sp. YBE204]
METRHDIIIVGAGMAGMTVALALAKGGLDVVMVERMPLSAQVEATYDGRASAIAYSCFRQWQALGVGAALEPLSCRMNEIVVTDAHLPGAATKKPSPFFLHFDAAEISDRSGDEPLGYMIENRHTRAALHEAVVAAGIRLITPAKVAHIKETPGQVVLTLDTGEVLSAPLVVAAEGRNSPLREHAKIKTIGWDYGQSAVVATVKMEHPHNHVAYEYFLSSGPFAILPLTDNRACLVWSESHAKAKALLEVRPELFHAHLMQRFGEFLGQVELTGPKFIYPLSMALAEDMYRGRIALLGDAAHGIHPIAGQGLNLGLKDAAALAEVVIEAARLGEDIGAESVLERYAQWRRFENVSTSIIMDGFVHLFSNNNPIVRVARDVGMGVVNAIGPARRFFMEDAGGATGDLPKLLRGQII